MQSDMCMQPYAAACQVLGMWRLLGARGVGEDSPASHLVRQGQVKDRKVYESMTDRVQARRVQTDSLRQDPRYTGGTLRS